MYRNYFCPRELLFDCDALAPVQINDGDEPYPGQSVSLQAKTAMIVVDIMQNCNMIAAGQQPLRHSRRTPQFLKRVRPERALSLCDLILISFHTCSYWRVENGYTLSSAAKSTRSE